MKSALQTLFIISLIFHLSHAFSPSSFGLSRFSSHFSSTSKIATAENVDSSDGNEIIGMTLTVKGDVNGGYTRTCIRNEASLFRKLIGTMSPPGDSDTATIYVEGKRSKVEGFVRWCKKASKKLGLNRVLEVVDTAEEVATGLYDGFYVKVLEEE